MNVFHNFVLLRFLFEFELDLVGIKLNVLGDR
jgi:hypothetical protein